MVFPMLSRNPHLAIQAAQGNLPTILLSTSHTEYGTYSPHRGGLCDRVLCLLVLYTVLNLVYLCNVHLLMCTVASDWTYV